jgi:hypothetical protein
MAGPDSDLVESYKFDPNRKITRVEVIDDYYGEIRIKFYSGENFSIKLLFLRQDEEGDRDDIRSESFEIADDEQLIGCELHHELIEYASSILDFSYDDEEQSLNL